jgi:transcriptional regulator with XRE-family HTH domain
MQEQPKNPRDLGVMVALLRALRNWSQRGLARKSGISQGRISAYERGEVLPKRPTLERIAGTVGVRYETAEPLLPHFRQLLAELAGGGTARALELPADLTAGLLAAITAVVPRAEVQFALDIERLARGDETEA